MNNEQAALIAAAAFLASTPDITVDDVLSIARKFTNWLDEVRPA